ncbi:MAG TPA: glycoside hydrolase domain-containing protein [Acidobacteriaceae bacterium]|jgi:hypothetical protein
MASKVAQRRSIVKLSPFRRQTQRISSCMRLWKLTIAALTLGATLVTAGAQQAPAPHGYLGFDANNYPGDDLLPALRKQFAFTGYWLTNPPLTKSNPWIGKRDILLRNGFGFLVLADGRWDKQILRAQKAGKSPAALAREDAAVAVAAARREGFPPQTIIFLDQEEGGRMLPEQAEYLLGWTEGVARANYRPGVYASAHPVSEGKGPDGKPVSITTIQDIREHVAAQHLHPIAFWAIEDSCPPAPGCVVNTAHPPSPNVSGILDADAWQYAQSPRTDFAKACRATYKADACYAPGIPSYHLDLDAATSPDPSHGR